MTEEKKDGTSPGASAKGENEKDEIKEKPVEAGEVLDSKDETREGTKVSKVRKKKGKKSKVVKLIKKGQAHIQATYNNTVISLSDQNGNILTWASAGKCGFKGPKKSTPYAAGIVVKDAVERATKERGLKEVNVFVKGVGAGREAAVRALSANGLTVLAIKDVTPIPHGGCRPRKVRRV